MNKKCFKTMASNFKIKFCFGLLMLSLTSCMGFKSSASTSSGKNLYETFFVGNDGTQYFIKPLSFTDKDKNRLTLDLTFRYKNQIKDSCIVNASFFDNAVHKSMDSVIVSNESVRVKLMDVKHLFSERSGNKVNSRFSTKGSLIEVSKLFENANWKATIYFETKQIDYFPPQQTKRKIDKLRYGIFMLF